MKNFKILALALFAIVTLECNPPPTPAPSDAAPLLKDSAVVDTFIRRTHSTTPTVVTPDTRSAAQIAQAACTAADGSWRCASKKPVTFASTGNTPITPVSWTVPSWFVDPQNLSGTASDKNDCVTSATACLTWAEIAAHRLGFSGVCASPSLSQNTVITFLSSHTDSTDPINLCPSLRAGSYVSLQGTAPGVTGATFTRNVTKSRAAGTNRLLSGSFSAGAPATGIMVQNTTAAKFSRAFVYTTAGGANWNLTQPLALQSVPTTVFVPAEVDTWNTGDTVNLLSLVAVNLVMFAPQVPDTSAAVDNFAYLYQLDVFDPGGVGKDNVYLNASVMVQEVSFQRNVSLISAGNLSGSSLTHSSGCLNAFFKKFLLGNSGPQNAVLFTGGGVATLTQIGGRTQFDGDFVAGGGIQVWNGYSAMGLVFMDGGGLAFGGSTVAFVTLQYGSTVTYGSATANWNFQDISSGRLQAGTSFTSAWTAPTMVSTGIQLNGASTGQSHTGASPDVINSAISTTVAHLDAAAGVAGFGGTAFNAGGASVSNVLP